MKKLLTALLISVAAIAAPACAKEEPKAPETKKVCVDVKDKNGVVQKDAKGNPKQKCMTVKVHKKLEGATVVPGKK